MRRADDSIRGRVEQGDRHAQRVAPSDEANTVEARALHSQVGVGGAYPLDDVAGEQIHDADAAGLAVDEGGGEERARVAGRVGLDEERVEGESAPRGADGAEAAYILRGETQQDIVERVAGQLAGDVFRGRQLALLVRRRRRHR